MKKPLYLAVLLLAACRPIDTNPDILTDDNDSTVVMDQFDPEIKENKEYHASETIFHDLINTKLEVSFDWANTRMSGKETLTAKPHFYATDSLILDAKGMEIKSVSIDGKALNYTYANDFLRIHLGKTYMKNETYNVVIDYVAKPEERTTGGSSAITSDKGLYFINPKGLESNKMPQIWTQGETEASSVWFPTIDQPNIKTKQEVYITVDDKYATLSNGKLISSTKNANGTRTDYWKQELPHAPYLFMMAVGQFKVVKDTYTRPDGTKMEVNYYVEPEWEPYAKSIFGETPNMIAHFSKLLGVEYPWDKYSQIVVREYVSGAMENTGAVIFGDYAYKNDRELLDGNDQSTIAHELFHHWFGDLVTCESWSNLSLNESFANYSQYLWDEHKFGLDEADYQALGEMDGYFASADNGGYHNLIWFDYQDKEEMFDGHSYNKGGRILHMLRNYLGDDAFFTALQNYLKTNAYKPAEFNQLRIAFEEVAGEDLNWFFNQWYLDKGHFDLDLTYSAVSNDVTELSITQNQGSIGWNYFKMPVNVTVFDDRGATKQRIWINAEEQTTVSLKTVGSVKNILFDSEAMILGKLKDTKSDAWYVHQFYNGVRYKHRRDGLMMGTRTINAESEKMIMDALKDPFWDIRRLAIQKASKLTGVNASKAMEEIKTMAANDVNSSVRMAAMGFLSTKLDNAQNEAMLVERIQKDQSYSVISDALNLLSKTNKSKALELAEQLEGEKSSKMQAGIASIYSKSDNPKYIAYFEKGFKTNLFQGYDRLGALGAFCVYMGKMEPIQHRKALPIFEQEIATGGGYVAMFMPRYLNYIKSTVETNLAKYQEELKSAQASNNTNAANIAEGKISEANAIITSYEKLIEQMAKAEMH